MEDNKFYVPTIEEFHVGFEFERLVKLKGGTSVPIEEHCEIWEKEVFTEESLVTALAYWPFVVRVKYLDREDIESLDWVLDEEEDGRMIFTHKYLSYIRLFTSIQEYSTDRPMTISSDTSILFTGNIKNKSRLKSIMDWTGVLVEKFEGTDEITNI